jgi:hypothetical protein
MKSDAELIDWLQKQQGCGLISSDNGYWAVSTSGIQNVPVGGDPQDIDTTFFVFKHEWKSTIREAILAAMDELGGATNGA